MRSLSAFVTGESKSSVTIFSTSPTKKRLFSDTSCNFLIIVLISIVPLPLIPNKLGNNFNCDIIYSCQFPHCKVMQMKYHHLHCHLSLVWGLCHYKTILYVLWVMFFGSRIPMEIFQPLR